MKTPEQRAAHAANMRRWRAENAERAREIQAEFAERWKQEHPDDPRTYWQAYRAGHPDVVKDWQRTQITRIQKLRAENPEPLREKHRTYYQKWAGIPERVLGEQFAERFPEAISLDYVRPDFYIPGEGFIEIKRALDQKIYGWSYESPLFPGLFFLYAGGGAGARRTVDVQIALMPRPLTVIVYHALQGHELCRQFFL